MLSVRHRLYHHFNATRLIALVGYLMLLAVHIYLIAITVESATVVERATAEAGGQLTCTQAAATIGDYYHPDRSLRGFLLHMMPLVSLLGMYVMLIATVIVSKLVVTSLRTRLLIGVGVVIALYAPIFANGPALQLVECAVG